MKPNWNTLRTLALALSFAGPALATAQPLPQDPPEPEISKPTGTRAGKKAARIPVAVSLQIEGVPAEAVPGVLAQVRELQRDVFACAECSFRGQRAGACPRCESELEQRGTTPVVARADFSIDRRYLELTLHPQQRIGFAELDALLIPVGGKVKREGWRVPAFTRLSLTGLGADSAKKVRAVLVDAKLFAHVSVVDDPEAGRLWVVPRVVTPEATLDDVTAAIAKLEEEFELADVQWTAPCEACGKKGSLQSGCSTCW